MARNEILATIYNTWVVEGGLSVFNIEVSEYVYATFVKRGSTVKALRGQIGHLLCHCRGTQNATVNTGGYNSVNAFATSHRAESFFSNHGGRDFPSLVMGRGMNVADEGVSFQCVWD